jgi:hypothetical protein
MRLENTNYMSALSLSPIRRIFLRDVTVAGVLSIFLIADQSYAQTARNGAAEASVSGLADR